MINTIKNIVTWPLSLVFDYSLRKFSFFISLILLALLLLAINLHINNMSFSLLNQKLVIEEEVSESTTSTVVIQKGDTLSNILKKENIDSDDIQKITKIAESENLTLLKIGKTITFEYTINLIEKDGEELAIEQKVLNMLSFEIDNIKSIDIIKSENDFSAQVNSVPLTKLITK